ncbi:MAG: ABC transporter ATP-binding protein [Patescibacteria group bacterium]|nr:ABC transporter ATP-binding protein [Patescibacteria group bacterium]
MPTKTNSTVKGCLTDTVIEIESLNKQYENDEIVTKVLHDVSFQVPKGQFLAIMGPSGSGKSTLMHIIGMLDSATSGIYKFEGTDISEFSDDEKAQLRGEKIGFVFQSFNLLSKASVLENVKLPLLYSNVPHKDRDAMAMEAINAVGLGHRVENLSNQLSGGERQRVAIARALIRKPSVIFADEPTGNLDSKSGMQVMQLLQDLNLEQCVTIILVTHERYTAEHAEREIRLLDGKIVSDQAVANRRIAKNEKELLK